MTMIILTPPTKIKIQTYIHDKNENKTKTIKDTTIGIRITPVIINKQTT